MALVSQSDKGNPACYTAVVPFLLSYQRPALIRWDCGGRKLGDSIYSRIFPFTGCFTARDIESFSWYTYDSPYFIHLFVLSNYLEREHYTQTNT